MERHGSLLIAGLPLDIARLPFNITIFSGFNAGGFKRTKKVELIWGVKKGCNFVKDIHLSIILAFIGVVVGALFGPVCDAISQRWILRNTERTLANGLALLCAANGCWVLSFTTWGGTNALEPEFILTAILSIGALIFFRGALTQFLGAEMNSGDESLRTGLQHLVGGNVLWLIGDTIEGVLLLCSKDEPPFILMKYAFYVAAAMVLWAAHLSIRRTVNRLPNTKISRRKSRAAD